MDDESQPCSLGGEDSEMVLGLVWRHGTDTLGLRVKTSTVVYTRVGLLSKVASLFEPLGTAAPVTVKAKICLRQLGVKSLQWDEIVSSENRA